MISIKMIGKRIGERQDTDAAELNLGEFFEDLRELFENNHISIKVASEHR